MYALIEAFGSNGAMLVTVRCWDHVDYLRKLDIVEGCGYAVVVTTLCYEAEAYDVELAAARGPIVLSGMAESSTEVYGHSLRDMARLERATKRWSWTITGLVVLGLVYMLVGCHQTL